jgi:plasmid stabilization system protein ParE
MRVDLTKRAKAELDEIIEFIAAENPIAAGRVATAIDRTLAWIGRWPLMSPIVHKPDIRAKLALPYQFRVFYTITGADSVIVRNIRSTRQLRPWEARR